MLNCWGIQVYQAQIFEWRCQSQIDLLLWLSFESYGGGMKESSTAVHVRAAWMRPENAWLQGPGGSGKIPNRLWRKACSPTLYYCWYGWWAWGFYFQRHMPDTQSHQANSEGKKQWPFDLKKGKFQTQCIHTARFCPNLATLAPLPYLGKMLCMFVCMHLKSRLTKDTYDGDIQTEA